ncbi:MAG: DUF2946 family protein [Acidobacteria bacterium]|nr:DUF2946 family protein [Acidobacteriota bacterium]
MRLRRAPRARALSCLLLVLVVLGTTVDAVHSHDLTAQGQASLSPISSVSVSAAERSDGSTRDPLRSKDCPVCQLHKQLGNALLYQPVFTPAPPTEFVPQPETTVTLLSASVTPRRGRAPPPDPLS